MAKEIKTKSSFGTIRVDHVSPPLSGDTPKGINLVISFEEALKLHLGLLQVLGKLNGYNRNTAEGKASAINLCLFTDTNRLTINEDKVKQPKK
ncbi:MAG: hypothetical protein JSS72_07925 [Armatimonadetes bacterium]|nr:hypothetical protein [Armatimonadota bacterium]